MEEHVDLRKFSGQSWDNSPALSYLQNLPISNTYESPVSAMRYLLPRHNIFTFGFENAFTKPDVYFSCKTCQSIIKRHEIKTHMLSKHPNLEETTVGSRTQTSTSHVKGKSKRNSRKNKKKVIPPPNAPPPPLFTVPPLVEPPKPIPPQILHSINVTIPSPLPDSTTYTTIKLECAPSLQTQLHPNPTHVVSVLKSNSEQHNHRRLKTTKDKLDNSEGSSSQSCADEHSTNTDKLLKLDKLSKEITKQSNRPDHTAPNIASVVSKEAKDGYRYIEVVYDEILPLSTQTDCVNKIKRGDSVLKGMEISESPNRINIPPLLPKLSEPSTLSSLHPKPMTMSRGCLRRVGSGILLQNFSPLERQRMDLQAVVEQYKQLQIPSFNKNVLFNSNKANKVF